VAVVFCKTLVNLYQTTWERERERERERDFPFWIDTIFRTEIKAECSMYSTYSKIYIHFWQCLNLSCITNIYWFFNTITNNAQKLFPSWDKFLQNVMLCFDNGRSPTEYQWWNLQKFSCLYCKKDAEICVSFSDCTIPCLLLSRIQPALSIPSVDQYLVSACVLLLSHRVMIQQVLGCAGQCIYWDYILMCRYDIPKFIGIVNKNCKFT